jgi:hypothetical protein
VDLIIVGVALRDRIRTRSAQSVIVGDVGSQAANERRGRGVLVELREEGGRGLEVGRPAKPASMSSVEVHVDTDGVELLDSIRNGLKVGRLGIGAFLNAQVGDQVGERVGLDDSNDANIGDGCLKKKTRSLMKQVPVNCIRRPTLDLSNNLINIVLVVRQAIVRNAKLSIGCQSSTISVRQIVDHNWYNVLLAV